MTPTLAAVEAEETMLQSEVESQPQTLFREFCPVCFTDEVAVLAGGLIYCPDCGHTTDTQTHAGD